MAATSIDRQFLSYGSPIEETHPVNGSAVLKVGALANFNSSGELVDATDAASQQLAGIVLRKNEDGTALIGYGHCVELNLHASVTAAKKNTAVCLLDNQTVATAETTTNDVVVGVFAAFVPGSTTKGFVQLRQANVTLVEVEVQGGG